MPLPDTKPIWANADDLLHRVTTRLDQLGCRVPNFWISNYEDTLILHGQVATQFAKNLIQYVVAEISGRPIISKDVQVE